MGKKIQDKKAVWLPLAIFGALVLVLILGLSRGDAPVSKFAQHVGDPAPMTDLPLIDGAGARFETQAWRAQGMPYVVNFFASWCLDCRAEHEELLTLAAGQIPIVGVAFKDRPDRAMAYLNKKGNPYVAVALDPDGRAGIDWGLTGVPETFLIDGRGVIRWHHIGRVSEEVATGELMPLWQVVKRGE